MLAMHAIPFPGSIRHKIIVAGVDQFLDIAPYNFTTPGSPTFTVDQPFNVSVETQGGTGGNGGNVPSSAGATGGASNLDGGTVSGGGAGGSSGFYSGRTVTEGPAYDITNYHWRQSSGDVNADGINDTAMWVVWAGTTIYPFTYFYSTGGAPAFGSYAPGDGWTYYPSGGDHGGGDYSIYRQTTVYDVPNFGGTGVVASVVTATVTLSAGAHAVLVGAVGASGSGAGASSPAGHVKLT